MNLNPKARFLASPQAKVHVDLVASSAIHESLQIALAQMQLDLAAAPDMGTAAAQEWRMQGAKQFISTWLNLAEPSPERKPDPRQNLQRT